MPFDESLFPSIVQPSNIDPEDDWVKYATAPLFEAELFLSVVFLKSTTDSESM